ncbi:hypothetical protein JR316_0003313 [Psilocybe cubensis]|uniref:Uncharacterized protein n=2 Tax=Psilocybe cubensis TaxID=181762 RepID=A0ACB8H773_PSICU|nr:hypothetical protein JR316_0003313 [Psilocybe cubensis]KAH9483835.1 hypothetical protein JR316_0003313 [Psilocybe cubensis]
MASSSSSEEYGARRPNRLVRHDSSFLGTIKHIVTAPLNWFSTQDEDDAPDSWGKRRRADPSVSPPANDEDTLSHRSKRLRLHSPPQAQPPARRSSVVPRAASAVLPSSRATLSPRRPGAIARTMSIDPPRRDAAFNFAQDPLDDMDMLVDRNSRPPSPRPSFRMRASLTPQPQQPPPRYISEPPPLNNLVSNPTFLRPPSSASHEPSPGPTLGTIVESARATKSPTRHQHSALHISSTVPEDEEDKDAPAERVLQRLDLYKTPLVPTRLRSSKIPASVAATRTPEMFKSRRSGTLVLMQDDRDRSGRRISGTGKSPLVNETKPYAGEGGMKKLLARRKQEEEEDNNQNEGGEDESIPRARHPSPSPSVPVNVPPVPKDSDWFSTAATSGNSGSSLRVGRAKTSRNHIQRPSKTRFSAVYDEEADDGNDDDNQKDRQMLEEAAKKVPVFDIPAGFSFIKPASSIPTEGLESAKEPPITSLPFSFSKPSTAPPPPAASAQTEVQTGPTPPPVSNPKPDVVKPALPPVPVTASGIPNFFASSSVLAKAKETPPPTPIPNLSFTPSTPPSGLFSFTPGPSNKSEPVKDAENPFWDGDKKKADEPKSNLFDGFGKRSDVEPVKPGSTSIFGASTSVFPTLPKATTDSTTSLPFSFAKSDAPKSTATPSPFGSNPPPEPLKSAFTLGAPSESKPQAESSTPKPLFGTSTTPSLFGETPKAASTGTFGEQPKFPSAAPAQSTSTPFNFGAPVVSTPTVAPTPPPQPSIFGTAVDPKPEVQAPKALFGGDNSTGFAFGQVGAQEKPAEAKSTPFSFGQPAVPEKSEVKSTPFSFGQPIAQEKPAEVKSTPFSFGPSTAQEKPTEAKPASFSFGVPATTTTETKPASLFSFGQSATSATPAAPVATPAQPISFSFSGGGSTSADVSNKPLFMFGQPSSSAPTARPVTPPKNNDAEFRMEESPTRDLQQVNGNKTAATLNGAFSFGTSGSSTLGGPLFSGIQNATSTTPASTPFGGFGSTSSGQSSNPFGVKDSKPEEPKGFNGFGQTAAPPINTSFSFGQPKPAEDQRPTSGGGFSFGAATSPAAATPNQAFAFGAPTSTNPFGQPSTASAPSSPSTFNQPSPFAFGAPAAAPATNAPFSFGSQPASPAGGANLSLPQSSGGFGGAGFGQPQQPSSPFSAPIALTPSTSGGAPGGSLFTIGAAPAAPPTGGPRQIKKLPTRRTTTKR